MPIGDNIIHHRVLIAQAVDLGHVGKRPARGVLDVDVDGRVASVRVGRSDQVGAFAQVQVDFAVAHGDNVTDKSRIGDVHIHDRRLEGGGACFLPRKAIKIGGDRRPVGDEQQLGLSGEFHVVQIRRGDRVAEPEGRHLGPGNGEIDRI